VPDGEKTMNKKALREHLPLAPQREDGFRWRGEHISRVEGFTDAVFAFAVTLLVVSLEVPHTFNGLLDVVRALPAFVICFTLLMTFWNAHFRFHRRYGLEDFLTRFLTMAMIVLVLFFVYPLKFLFTMVTVAMFGLELTNAPHLDSREQLQTLYLIYGLGFAGVWGLYALMYWNALRQKAQLGLNAVELVYTKASIVENLNFIGVCMLSIVLSRTVESYSLPGWIYAILGPMQAFTGVWYGRKIKALQAQRS
jgi:uncharacterized membrane protein